MTERKQFAWEGARPDLTGKVVVVIGGSGGVGEGVVRTLVTDGATVVATGRDLSRLADLVANISTVGGGGRLVTEVLDAAGDGLDDEAARLAERYGPFDGVVISVASWGEQGRKPALSLTDAEWDDLIAGNLTSVFRLLRAFVPHTKKSGIVLQLNGMSADLAFPGGAGIALSAAATKSLTRTIAAELGSRGPRVYQVVLGVVRTRARRAAGIDDLGWLDGEEIGAHIAGLVAATSPLVGIALQYHVEKATGPVAGSDRF
ncbi:SDR family oxidoreductase [Microbacterium sp. P03]|uniref:SDR family oxidoreductase n=1 Tax=Microbacterium sp. P03 TaxID=3366946 RepID=UPI003746D4F7